MVWWLLGGSIVLNLVLVFLTRNMLRKNEYAEDYISDLLRLSEAAIRNMRDVDIRGSFEADDEVGVTFRALSEVIKDYAEVLGFEIGDDKGEYGKDNT